MNWKFWEPEPTIKFKSVVGAYNVGPTIQLAKKVFPDWLKKQVAEKDVKFATCPGMFDLLQAGYIIPAWADMRIKANRAGTFVEVKGVPSNLAPSSMEIAVVKGLVHCDETVKPVVTKIPAPWALYCKKGYSVHALPALFHSPFLDKIFVYPGVVDSDSFATMNFIFTAKTAFEIDIYAGTPLLQIIPFKRETITAQVGKATEYEKDLFFHRFYTKMPQAYRKLFHKRKEYKLENLKYD